MNQIYSLFPSLVHWIEIPSFKKVQNKIIKYAYNEKKNNKEGLIASNVNGWQSDKYYHLNDNIISTTIRSEVYNYFTLNKALKENTKLTFNAMWININGKDAYNSFHIHPDCEISGVFWIKVPENSGNISFNSPNMHSGFVESSSYNEDLCKATNVYPNYTFYSQEGVMILFPSYLYHQVMQNRSSQDRISVSFNLKLS